jgi:hypothetical protein
MSSNVYYGVKDAEFNLSFVETKWLNLNETLAKLKINTNSPYNTNLININPSNLIYPNELVLANESSSTSSNIVDILLLAKYTDKCGNLKLKSVLLSQLINKNSSSLKSNRFLILSLPKDSYYWSKCEAHLIPSYALRVGYDSIAKQFSYIGRVRVLASSTSSSSSSPPASPSRSPSKSPATLSGLIGTITNLYEFIPAIVLQLHDLSYSNDKKLFTNINQSPPPSSPTHHEYFNHSNAVVAPQSQSNESFWSRLRSAIKNNASSPNEFNFNYLLWNNYEVLCLRQQPLTLKQASVLALKSIEEITLDDMLNSNSTPIDVVNVNKSLRSLPRSLSHLVWPSYLERGQCIVRNSKMRSENGTYELEITSKGQVMLTKLTGIGELVNSNNILRQVTTYEKNVEAIVVIESGVFLVYDNNQAMRKPSQLYNHLKNKSSVIDSSMETSLNSYENLLFFNASLHSNTFILELSNSGYLRVIYQEWESTQKSMPKIINILNLNEYFISLNSHHHSSFKEYQSNFNIVNPSSGLENGGGGVDDDNKNAPSVEINVKLVASLNGLKNIPLKIASVTLTCIKLLFQSISSLVRSHL